MNSCCDSIFMWNWFTYRPNKIKMLILNESEKLCQKFSLFSYINILLTGREAFKIINFSHVCVKWSLYKSLHFNRKFIGISRTWFLFFISFYVHLVESQPKEKPIGKMKKYKELRTNSKLFLIRKMRKEERKREKGQMRLW